MREMIDFSGRVGQTLKGALTTGALLLALTACDQTKDTASGSAATDTIAASAADVSEEFRVSSQGGFVIGLPDAPVKVVEFASFTCSHCAQFHAEVFPKLMEKYILTGQVEFEMRPFLRNEPDFYASLVLDCAGPERFEGLVDLYFKSQPEWLQSTDPNAFVSTMAKRAGFSSSRYDECTTDTSRRQTALKRTQAAIQEFDIQGTPTLVVNGKVAQDGAAWIGLDRAIQNAM